MKHAQKYRSKIGSAGILLAALSAASCMDLGDEVLRTELGAVESSFTVNATAGHVDIRVYSNQDALLSFLDDGATWADLSDTRVPRDGKFYIDYADNEGFPRMTRVLIQSADAARSDTVVLRQRGARVPTMAFEGGTSTNIPGSAGGLASMRFNTNIDPGELTFTTQYDSEGSSAPGEWITDIELQPVGEDEYTFAFDYAGNETDELRAATVKVSYVNGWEEPEEVVLNVIQRTKDDLLGHDISFAELREKALTVSRVDEYWLLEGYVVSDRDSKNAGSNPMPTDMSVDYSGCEKTVYIESIDGHYGFCVETSTPEDNIFKRYDKVKILLKGAELVYEPNPARYAIKGIKSSMVAERVAGSAATLPVKEKYIDELTDEDIYTFVTLKACEFSVRKGSFTPVHEGYTLAEAQGRLNMYPRLVRDSRGSTIHLLTNTTCPYRRDGRRLPYGSGDLAGVIVHERFPQYEYADQANDAANGIIGTYQVRHMAYEDIRFAPERSQSFSETLTEYCYVKGKATASDGYAYWYPTWGTNGRFTQTASKTVYTNGVYNATCWHYLGWCGTARGTAPFRNHIGNDGHSGFGVVLEDGTNYAVNSKTANTDGKGGESGNWLAWVTTYWWNASTDRPYAWVVEFSTEELSSSPVSLIMSIQSGRATLNAGPFFWKVQWSDAGDYESDEGWHDVEASRTAPDGSTYTYTQPDFPVFATQRSWQLPAYKQVEIPLPTEIMGREKVRVRIQPASRLSSGLAFLDGTIPMGYNAAGAMDYLAIRYNK